MTMTHKRNAALSVCTLLSTILLANSSYAQDAVGRNSAVTGTVTIQSIGQDIRSAAIRDDIFLGDDIGSAVDSSLQILLLDETVFTVGASAQLTIDEFVYDPNSNGNRMSASIKKGMFRFMSGNVSSTDPQNVELNTPVASLGIRGTIVEGFVGPEAVNLAIDIGIIDPSDVTDPDGASFIVLRGPGPRNGGGDTEGLVDVLTTSGIVRLDTPGEAVFVQDVDAVPEVFDLPVEAFRTFSAQIRSVPNGPPPPRPALVVPNMPTPLPPPPPPNNMGPGPGPGGPSGAGAGAGPGAGGIDFDPLVDIDGAIEEEPEEEGCTFAFECTGEPEQ